MVHLTKKLSQSSPNTIRVIGWYQIILFEFDKIYWVIDIKLDIISSNTTKKNFWVIHCSFQVKNLLKAATKKYFQLIKDVDKSSKWELFTGKMNIVSFTFTFVSLNCFHIYSNKSLQIFLKKSSKHLEKVPVKIPKKKSHFTKLTLLESFFNMCVFPRII